MGEAITGNQERNIMIMFLSNLHYQNYKINNDGSREVNEEANYMIRRSEQGEEIVTCVETNEAPLKDVLATLGNDNSLHAVFYFATKKVRAEQPLPYRPKQEGAEKIECYNEADFFWRGRVQELVGEVFKKTTKLIQIDFDEDNEDPVGGSITAVTTLENKIREYLREQNMLLKGEFPLNNCNLYVDITGGMRTANMVMSAAMQLLRYEGAKLKRVVYSDFDRFRPSKKEGEKPIHPVSNVQPINDMYQLVAGVDAFTKYGSSAALNEYFEDVKKDCKTLRNLLDAMNAFSESVLLCQPNDIVDNLSTLVPQLESFEDNLRTEETPPAKVSLFARMLEKLKEIYTPMYPKTENETPRKEERIAIIHWCVRNSLLQQALSFCTEWLPEHLIEHGVIYVDDLNMQRFLMKIVKDKEHDSLGKKHFLMKGITGEFPIDSVYEKPIQDTIRGLIDNKIDINEAQKFLPVKFVNDFIQFLSTIQYDLDNNEKNNKRLEAVIKELVNPENKKQQKMKRAKIQKIHVLNKLKEWLSNMDKWYRGELFGLPKSEKREAFRSNPPQYIDKDQGGNAARLIEALLRSNILETSLTIPEAVYYIETYTNIRILRNKVDHVDDWDEENDSPFAQEAEMSLEFIGNYLANYLDNIDKLENKPKPHFTGLWAEDTKEAAK